MYTAAPTQHCLVQQMKKTSKTTANHHQQLLKLLPLQKYPVLLSQVAIPRLAYVMLLFLRQLHPSLHQSSTSQDGILNKGPCLTTEICCVATHTYQDTIYLPMYNTEIT